MSETTILLLAAVAAIVVVVFVAAAWRSRRRQIDRPGLFGRDYQRMMQDMVRRGAEEHPLDVMPLRR